MRRHEPVIVRSASSVVFTQNFLCFGDLCVDAASGKDQRGTEILGVIWVSRHFGPGQDTSDPRHFGTSAELSRHIGTGAKEDTSAPGNTGPSHGKVDRYACVIMRIRLEQQCYNINA